ncbi:MAG: beta-lactamase family protein [Ruminococcaceae bacterium]|nr:beta-lactamase family protein [Oscillospiraceae bacterium]
MVNKISMFKKALDCFIDSYYVTNGNSGILRVTVKDKIIYERFIGFADRETHMPFTNESMFSFYSLSKPFLAIGIMKLRDEGLIDIDSHPSRYVLEAQGFNSKVTIRNMLHHTSGLPDFVQTAQFDKKYDSGLPDKLREQLKELAEYSNLFEPGTNVKYANINMIICALAIENITGLSYSEYMKENVFNPLGMHSAYVDNKDLNMEHRVKGYEIVEEQIVQVERCINWMLGAGDIIGTVDDVYCLNLTIKHQKLLKPETWDEVLTPSPICTFGMGCRIDSWHGKKRIIHNGGYTGFRTLHIQLPEDDFDIIFLSNSGWGDARNDISEAIFREYYGNSEHPSQKIDMDAGYIN